MTVRFIIVDNRVVHIETLRTILVKLGYEGASIWPPESARPATNWPQALEALATICHEGWNPVKDCCVLFLDLALDPEDRQFAEGLGAIESARYVLEPYVTILWTLYPTQRPERLEAMIDGVADKALMSTDAAAATLQSVLQAAGQHWQSRTGRAWSGPARALVSIRDSPASRRAEAALGLDRITALVRRVADRWQDIKVDLLTGGYSGSYVLRIEGQEQGAPRSAVCKVAAGRALLEEEMEAWRRAATNPWYSDLVLPMNDTHVQRVDSGAWMVVQSTASGETLEKALRRDPSAPAALRLVEHLVKVAIAGVQANREGDYRRLAFTQTEVERARDAIDETRGLWWSWRQEGYGPDLDGLDEPAFEQLSVLLPRWADILEGAGVVRPLVYEQHGDLNARNAMVTGTEVHLIDLARFAELPACYDLVRLQLQLFLRLVDSEGLGDAFPTRLQAWTDAWLGGTRLLEGAARSGDPAYRTIVAIQGGIESVVAGVHASRSMALQTSVRVARVYQAVRMCSYQDATWFKKLFCVVLAVQGAREAGLLSGSVSAGGDGSTPT